MCATASLTIWSVCLRRFCPPLQIVARLHHWANLDANGVSAPVTRPSSPLRTHQTKPLLEQVSRKWGEGRKCSIFSIGLSETHPSCMAIRCHVWSTVPCNLVNPRLPNLSEILLWRAENKVRLELSKSSGDEPVKSRSAP